MTAAIPKAVHIMLRVNLDELVGRIEDKGGDPAKAMADLDALAGMLDRSLLMRQLGLLIADGKGTLGERQHLVFRHPIGDSGSETDLGSPIIGSGLEQALLPNHLQSPPKRLADGEIQK